jgi:DNA invertase Pin-like site-specific DNA recombinase
VYRGRKRALTSEQVAEIRKRASAGEKKAALAREFNVSGETLHQALKASYITPQLVKSLLGFAIKAAI